MKSSPKCPACNGSVQRVYEGTYTKLLGFILLLASIVLIFLAGISGGYASMVVLLLCFLVFIIDYKLPKRYRCTSCGNEFNYPVSARTENNKT